MSSTQAFLPMTGGPDVGAAAGSGSSTNNDNDNDNDNNNSNNDNNNDDNDDDNDPGEAFAPPPPSPPAGPISRYHCHTCGATRVQRRDMNNHWRVDHGWSQKKRDGLLREWNEGDQDEARARWGPWTDQEAQALGRDRETIRQRLGRTWRQQLGLRNVAQQRGMRNALRRDKNRAESLAKFREWFAGDHAHLDTDDGADWGQFNIEDATDMDRV